MRRMTRVSGRSAVPLLLPVVEIDEWNVDHLARIGSGLRRPLRGDPARPARCAGALCQPNPEEDDEADEGEEKDSHGSILAARGPGDHRRNALVRPRGR